MSSLVISKLTDRYHSWVVKLLTEYWGSTEIATRGRIHNADRLPGFIALINNKPGGLVTYNIDDNQCEIVTLNSLFEKKGIGSALVDSVRNEAYSNGCKRLWLITTNDNTHAFKFYQKLGFRVAAYHINGIEKSRKLKPIPYIGIDNIAIRDEIELEIVIEE